MKKKITAYPAKNNLSISTSIFFIVTILSLISCGKKDFRYDYFTVKEVVSGNQIELWNGYIVNLIGIEDNERTHEFLRSIVTDRRVRFVFDSHSPFKRPHPRAQEKSFYAYVILEREYCINSKMLKEGLSDIPLPQYYLNDSLEIYKNYANVITAKPKVVPKPEPEEKPTYTPDTKPREDPFSEYIISGDCKIELEKLKHACDYNNAVTRNFAVSQAGRSSGNFNIGQVCELFSSVRSQWSYVEDPKGMEFYSIASQTIEQAKFSGDCDDFAILMYSLVTAIGGDARIIFAWGSMGGHAFAEVDITDFSMREVKNIIMRKYYDFEINSVNYHVDADGNKWLNLDWWAAYPGGKYLDYKQYMIFYPRQNSCSRFN